MKNKTYLIYLLIIFCISCGNPSQQKEDSQKENTNTDFKASTKKGDNQKWMSYYNLKSDSLQYIYEANSIKILDDGEVLKGAKAIVDYALSDSLVLVSIESDTIISAHLERAIDYGINEKKYSNGDKYKTLVIWQTKDQVRKRVFEFTAKVEPLQDDLKELKNRRALWMNLCNQHNARNLIQELYTENTLYFNHKPLVIGRQALREEYKYMNNKDYQLSLQPEIIESVNKNFIFEIGQCAGSYNGKYILIWKKVEDGKWSIFIDSNI